MAPSFDPTRSVTFDVNRGNIELADGEPAVLVPAAALCDFIGGDSDANTLGRAMGVCAMNRVGMRLVLANPGARKARDEVRAAKLETIVELLGGELAIIGVGSLKVERWGSALLFVLDPFTLDARADPLLCGVFEGAIDAITERSVGALVVDRTASQVRVLVANPTAIARAEKLLRVGAFFTEIVSMLHDGTVQGGGPKA